MDFEVYCDESRPELFVSTSSRTGKTVIGSLWMPALHRSEVKQEFNRLRVQYGVWGEVKWNKVSPSKLDFYRALVRYFFDTGFLRFRAIVIDANQLNHERFHQSDAELGFYKFYYQLLFHWIEAGNSYAIFCDDKVNRDSKRLHTLGVCLAHANRGSVIKPIQSVQSHQSIAVQICDVLLGAVQWRVNEGSGTSAAKQALVSDIEERMQRRIGPTFPSERKFNVFEIRLQGGAA